MPGDGLLILAAACAFGGIAVLRWAWSRSNRSIPLNSLGWGLLLAACICGWAAAGAWGTSVATLCAMAVALVVLGTAASRSTPTRSRASNRRVRMLPETGEPRRIGRRIVTFVLVGIVAALLSIGLAVAASSLARSTGLGEGDANVLALFLMPLGWAVLAFVLLMQATRRGQVKLLLVASVPVWPVIAAGVLS